MEVGELSDISKVKFSKARRNVMREKREKEVVIKKKKKKRQGRGFQRRYWCFQTR